MTIDDIRAERKKTEDAIYSLLDSFRAKTGVCPVGVDVRAVLTMSMAGDCRSYVTQVSIKLESL